MARLDTWTDATVERSVHLIRVAEAVIREMRKTYVPKGQGIRPVTIDRWLTDATEYLEQHQTLEEEHATATAD